MNEIQNMITAARLAPVASGEYTVTHDAWTPARLAEWNSLGPSDRAREYDARIARGDRLVVPGEATKMRAAFVAGTAGFEVFGSECAIFPLIVAKAAGPVSQQKPIAATPAARPVVPVVPVAVVPRPVVVPVLPPPPRRETTSELFERRRREAAGETVAVPAATVATTGPISSQAIFASRQKAVDDAMAKDAAARASRGASIDETKPKTLAEPTTAEAVYASRRAVVDRARRTSDGGRDS